MKEIVDAARELGMADHISLDRQLLTIAYPPRNIVQLPVRDRAEEQAAIKVLRVSHMLKWGCALT